MTKITLEIAGAIFCIMLASWSGPTVHDAIAPKLKVFCPICNFGPNEPRSP